MSGPPPPPPPPGPPPPPAMAPPQMSKSDQHGRSALLTDISKGAKLKSAKHLMNDRSGLQTGAGGTTGKGGGAGAGIRPVMPPGCENGRVTAGRAAGSAGGRQPHGGGGGGGGASGTGTVRNAPPGLGDLFGGGIPKLKGAGSNTVGRSAGGRGGDRVSNGSVENFPPPPPLSSKPSIDFSDGASSTVGRSSGSRMSGGFPPPPSPSQLSRPLPGVPGPRPSGPPPPPTRAPPPVRPHENGQTSQGYNNRALPQTPSLPPKPPERKDSVGPPPPPFRAANGPPPPPNRGPPGHAPLPARPPPVGRSGPPSGPPPPPGPARTNVAPPPPPPVRPPVSVNRTNSTASSGSEFEAMFQFPTDLPHPDHFTPSNKTYPSQNPNRKGSTNTNRRPVPPPPPPGGP